jgi:rubrerythrin
MNMTSPLALPRRRARKRAKAATTTGRERNKRANVSQDSALYSCSCGYVFKAAVTTSVGCPHCGTDQAW